MCVKFEPVSCGIAGIGGNSKGNGKGSTGQFMPLLEAMPAGTELLLHELPGDDLHR